MKTIHTQITYGVRRPVLEPMYNRMLDGICDQVEVGIWQSVWHGTENLVREDVYTALAEHVEKF